MGLSDTVKVVRVMDAQAAGYGDELTGNAVDLQGYDGVEFIVALGAVEAGGSVELLVESSDTPDSESSMAEVGGLDPLDAEATDPYDNGLMRLDYRQPLERYVRPVIKRTGANVTIDGVLALLYGSRAQPIDNDPSVVAAGSMHH